jgi:hypothetical protein
MTNFLCLYRGLPISPRVPERFSNFHKFFLDWDILAFQEVAHQREVNLLVETAAKFGINYYHQFTQGVGFPVWNGVCAPGLLVLSRFPIADIRYHRYTVNGKIHRFDHSDYLGAKGVGLCRILINPGQEKTKGSAVGVDLFLTHLHANYSHYYHNYNLTYRGQIQTNSAVDEYLAHRVAQAYELARFIAANRRADYLTVLAGDLNAPPYDIVIHLLQKLAGLHDSFSIKNPNDAGYTSAARDNTFFKQIESVHCKEFVQPHKIKADHKSNEASIPLIELEYKETPKRIDYVLFSVPTHYCANSSSVQLPFSTPLAHSSIPQQLRYWELADSRVVKHYCTIDKEIYSLSDHHAVGTTFSVNLLKFNQLCSSNNKSSQNISDDNSSRNLLNIDTTAPALSVSISPSATPRTAAERPFKLAGAPALQSRISSANSPNTPIFSTSPGLLEILTVASNLILLGIQQTIHRRKWHWYRAMICTAIWIFINVLHIVAAKLSFIHFFNNFSSSFSQFEESVLNVQLIARYHSFYACCLYVYCFVYQVAYYLLPVYCMFEWILAQFMCKEEQMALKQTLAEILTHINYLKSSTSNVE